MARGTRTQYRLPAGLNELAQAQESITKVKTDTSVVLIAMLPIAEAFTFDYYGSDIVYGRGSIDQLGEKIRENGLERAMVVCGTNVGANDDLMDPVRDGLGETLVGVFDETTPEKIAETVYDGIDMRQELEADVLVGVGGGSSLDIARQISVYENDGRSLTEFKEAARTGTVEPPSPDESATAVVTVPTTFAGADISSGGPVEILTAEEAPGAYPVRLRGRIMPIAMFYDPTLFETTPAGAITGSAMNGFNKGLETLYALDGNPITDSTAIHGLRLLSQSYPKLPDNSEAMDRAVVGIILIQFMRKTSIIHAIGHGFARRYPVQQGVIHGIMAPHTLSFLFDRVDANRELLASGLHVDADTHTDSELADAVVDAVVSIRDSLGLPSQLRDAEGIEKDDLPAVAAYIREDIPAERCPVDPTVEEIEGLLREAW